MRRNLCAFLSAVFLFASSGVVSGQGISTFAGNGVAMYAGDNGPATAASLLDPQGIIKDNANNVLIGGDGMIRKVDVSGVITTYAGTGVIGYTGDNGPATAATISTPGGLTIDGAGNIYFTDQANSVVRMISTTGIISTVAGTGVAGNTGDNGAATAARLNSPTGIATDATGNIYVADQGNQTVRKITPAGIITTIAGTGVAGYTADGGAATLAGLNFPNGVAVDQSGKIYIADQFDNRVRVVSTTGIINTVAGTGVNSYGGDGGAATNATLNQPSGVIADRYGNVFITDMGNNVIRKVSASGLISTVAGTGVYGYTGDGGAATAATLAAPNSLLMDGNGNVYISDNGNSVVRFLSLNSAPTFAGGTSQTYFACFNAPATDISNLFAVNDFDVAQTESLTLVSGPTNGTVSGFPTSVTSTGSTVTPTGITYTPNTGYTGPDVFTVSVDDGNGGTATTTINVTVNPVATMNDPADQTVCNGSATSAVTFTSAMTGVTYSWANDKNTIGLASIGAGNIPAFTAVNTSSVTAIATVTVTPAINTCPGTPQTFTYTIYPTPTVASVSNQSVCNGSLSTPIVFSGTVSGTTYTWTNNLSSIGLANTGSGNIGSFTAMNSGATPVTANLVVTPSANGCMGAPKLFSITVNPSPTVSVPPNEKVCNSVITNPLNFNGTLPGTTYNWTNSDPSIGLAASGSGNIAPFIANNPTSSNVVATVNVTPVAAGCTGAPQSFTITVYPTPKLSTVLAPTAICDSTDYFFTLTSPTSGVTFVWHRFATTGISNPAASGVDTINEILVNTLHTAVPVVYYDTLTANGCINVEYDTVIVEPRPNLSSPMTAMAQCDSAVFKYSPTSDVTGASFFFTRDYVLGIDKLGATGVGNINDTLVNQTNKDIPVTYEYVIIANGCTDTEHIVVTVHPTPRLTSKDSASICSGLNFTYAPKSNVTGANFAWTRASVTGVTPATSTGTNTISETLINNTGAPLNAIYTYSVSTNGCAHKQNVVLTVNPSPLVPSIDNNPPSSLCAGTLNQSFGTSVVPATGVSYMWTATNATVYATGSDKQYALINFNTPGTTAVVTLTAKAPGGCTSATTFSVNVSSSVADATTRVTYFNGQFVCLQNVESGYQWGYDDAMLKSNVLNGEINQNYYNNTPDLNNNHYWVMVNHNGCTQKSYYNAPLSVAPVAENIAMRVYPNPASENINVAIDGARADVQVVVYNMLGQEVRTATTANSMATIDVRSLAPGAYIISCVKDDVKIATARFIKN